ncbi:glutamate racemase [Lacticaseibacillus brantae]|nr:glutamate racemase [Lacticaseibacillus brantae]
MNTQPIGFIDSGVGGLTVFKEALKQLPHENMVFLGDQARLPYGPRPAEQVVAFTWQMVNFMMAQNIKMLVIACNTATAAALDVVKAQLPIPVVGVILPGSRAALKVSQNNHIGVIATEGTVKAGAYAKTIHDKNATVSVTSLAAPKFVPVVESNEYQSPIAKRIVTETLAPLKHTDIDTLVMGCTHYPLLRPIIENVMGPKVTLIDPGIETVSEVSTLLDYFDIANNDADFTPTQRFFTTGSPSMFDTIGKQWLGLNQLHAQHVEIDQLPTNYEAAPLDTIVVATQNAGKAREFAAVFESEGIKVKTLRDFPELPDVAETGSTFEENARIKADTYARALELPVLADDSGLMVDALGGKPGVFSARYAGAGHNDAANNAKLMAELGEVPADDRTATFHTTLVFAKPNQPDQDLVVEGDLPGMIVGVPRGNDGFGYDPYFYVPEQGKTLAEMTTDEKNAISHRGQAIKALAKVWRAWYQED